MFPRDHRNLRIDRGDLYRDDFNLRLLQCREITLQPAAGILFPEQRFAEEIDVHPHALFPAGTQVLGEQLPLGGQDHVRRLMLHAVFDERHRDARQVRAE
jgi:hypothetical protein